MHIFNPISQEAEAHLCATETRLIYTEKSCLEKQKQYHFHNRLFEKSKMKVLLAAKQTDRRQNPDMQP